MQQAFKIDWRRPDYAEVFRIRMLNLQRLRDRPELFDDLKDYYRAGGILPYVLAQILG